MCLPVMLKVEPVMSGVEEVPNEWLFHVNQPFEIWKLILIR